MEEKNYKSEHLIESNTGISNNSSQNDRETLIQNNLNKDFNTTIDDKLVQNTNDSDLIPVTDPPRNCCKRTFGPMHQGSLRGAIFTLITMTVGKGSLSLPQVFNRIGFIEGIIAIILQSFVCYWSIICLEKVTRLKKCYDMSTLINMAFGKHVKAIMNVVSMLYYYMILVAYLVIIYELLGIVIFDFFYHNDSHYKNNREFMENSYFADIRFKLGLSISLTVFVFIPFSLIRDIGKLGFVSLLGIASFVYTVIVLIFQYPYFLNHNIEHKPPLKPNWYSLSRAFGSDLLFFPSIANIFYVFGNAPATIPVFKSLKNNTERRIHKVVIRTMVSSTVIFLVIAIFGVLSVPENTPDLIIFRVTIFQNDIIMTLAKIGLILSLSFAYSPNFGLFRNSYCRFIKEGETEFTDKENMIVTIISLLSVAIINSVFTKVNTCIGLVGGFLAVVICFCVPGALYIKLNSYSIWDWRNLGSLFVIIIVWALGWTGGVIVIINELKMG